MASDVYIPGDDLKQAQDMLGFINDFIDVSPNAFDFDGAFGPELSHGSAEHFEKKWQDGKIQLKKEMQGVKDAIGSILDAFEKTDQDAVSNLSTDPTGTGSGQ